MIMSERNCKHVGVEHPMNFQCLSCEDTADECNCFYTEGVFCDICQKIIWMDCDDVRDKWSEANPDKDMRLEKMVLQGHISSYISSNTTVTEDE